MGLIIAAAITTAVVLCGFAVLLVRVRDWRPLVIAFLVALPLQPLAFYLVRLPIDGFVRTTFGAAPWILLLSMLYAPCTEEPAKWLTTAVPRVRRAIDQRPVAVALAVGTGFGIGEIWFLAHALTGAPNYPDLSVWMFRGFIIERLEVCFLHGAFVAPLFFQLARKRPAWLGALAGMAMHFALNFPIYLAQTDTFGLGRQVWVGLLIAWPIVFIIACAIMLCRLARRTGAQSP
jgi:hypothetical protein